MQSDEQQPPQEEVSLETEKEEQVEQGDQDGEEELSMEGEQSSIIANILNQLRKGTDLHRISLPTFILEPRSMTERLSDFLSHQEYLLEAATLDGQAQFLATLKYFLSGFHVRPKVRSANKGVRKPYNPILGEFFRCKYTINSHDSYYICEQVSHHPPISAYFYACPALNIELSGELHPKARFSGNSASTQMEGGSMVSYNSKRGIWLTPPNIYARGLLFGKLFMELGDMATVSSPNSDLEGLVEFKTRPYFGKSNDHEIVGKIKSLATDKVVYKISGNWSSIMYITDEAGEKSVFVDTNKYPIIQKIVAPISEQEEFESRRFS